MLNLFVIIQHLKFADGWIQTWVLWLRQQMHSPNYATAIAPSTIYLGTLAMIRQTVEQNKMNNPRQTVDILTNFQTSCYARSWPQICTSFYIWYRIAQLWYSYHQIHDIVFRIITSSPRTMQLNSPNTRTNKCEIPIHQNLCHLADKRYSQRCS